MLWTVRFGFAPADRRPNGKDGSKSKCGQVRAASGGLLARSPTRTQCCTFRLAALRGMLWTVRFGFAPGSYISFLSSLTPQSHVFFLRPGSGNLTSFASLRTVGVKPTVFVGFSWSANVPPFYNALLFKAEKLIFLEHVCKKTPARIKHKCTCVKRLHFCVHSKYPMKYDVCVRVWCLFAMHIYACAK